MQKVGFPAMKGFDSLRSVRGSVPGSSSSRTFSMPRASSESSFGSFANLKLTAEKLVKEQTSVKMDLELANSKLKKAVEQIQFLELKLQDVNNENAKLMVKQKEDSKLWKGLDSKLSSTKTLCNQLTETLQHLAGQTSAAEEDKKVFEEKLLEYSKALDDLNTQINLLCRKLEKAEEYIKKGQREMLEILHKKEETTQMLEAERCAVEILKNEKDAIIKHLEGTIEDNKVHLQGLSSEAKELLQELRLKEDTCKSLEVSQENLNKEKCALQSTNDDFVKKIFDSSEEIMNLEDILNSMKSKVVELDKHSITVSNNVDQLASYMEICNKLAQQEKDLTAKCAEVKFEQLHNQHLITRTENEALSTETELLKGRIMELQKTQEFVMVQHAEECHLAEDKVRMLETEAGKLISKKNDLEMLVTKLEEKIRNLSDSSSSSENEVKELLLKTSGLQSENQDLQEKMQLMLQENAGKIKNLEKVILEHESHVASLETQITQVRCVLDEKEQGNIELAEKLKLLEEQKSEIEASLASAECNLTEAKKQYELIVEGKQLELTRHLKEISQKNDQAINDIRKKYEVEKLEIVTAEKQKALDLIKELERKCDDRINGIEEEAKQRLLLVQEDHAAKISQVKQQHDQRESILRAHHKEEIQRVQFQAENELREKTLSLKKEYEIQTICLRQQLEDEYGKLHEELELQRAKEDKQRALLQLQWKVMDEKSQQNDVEVNSKKEYSVSSTRMRDTNGRKGSQLASNKTGGKNREVDISGIMRTPVANMLKKVENGDPGSIISVPKHGRKQVTHHEYEIETSNGKTITKRRKTRSTVMFRDPAERKRVKRKTPTASKDVSQVTKAADGMHPRPSNIGDLFREGSLNPYTDDPYAFD